MSVKVSAWVWEHANDKVRHRGTAKLLLLALADHANDSGVCWPSAATLAGKIGETERHTRRLLKELADAGDLLIAPGGGRGNTTRYGIAVGLNDKQRAKLNRALQNTVSQNTVLENTDTENSDISARKQCPTGTETVTSGHAAEGQNTASESVKVPQKSRDNHHRTVIEPSIRTPRPAGAASETDHQKLMTAYQEWLGYPIPNGGKEGAAAKRLLKAGYTVAQIDGAYHELKARDFYSRGHLSLVTVHEQIGAVLSAQRGTNNAKQPAQPVRQNPERPTGGFQWRTKSAGHVNGAAARNGDELPGMRGADRAAADEGRLEGPPDAVLE